jgi:hypothetical protein
MKPSVVRLLAPFVLLMSAIVACTPSEQKTLTNVENAVFTGENVICMVDGLLSNSFTLAQAPMTVAQIATDIEGVCSIAPTLLTDVENFVNVFVPPAPVADAGTVASSAPDPYAAKWAAYRAKHRR